MSSSSKSRWIPLESNPEVFNSWANKAGLVASQAQFEDVYGLDDELLAMVSKPVKAIILLFPDSGELAAKRTEEDAKIASDGQIAIDPTVLWIKQTIDNACGTMALLHALANSDVTFVPHSPLARFIDLCRDKTPIERATLLEITPLFANIHAESATAGQTPVPADLDTTLHFTCFVTAPEAELRAKAREGTVSVDVGSGGAVEGSASASEAPATSNAVDGGEKVSEAGTGVRLIELDGDRGGPIDRGECKDLLADVAKIVKEKYIPQSASMHFSMLALSRPA